MILPSDLNALVDLKYAQIHRIVCRGIKRKGIFLEPEEVISEAYIRYESKTSNYHYQEFLGICFLVIKEFAIQLIFSESSNDRPQNRDDKVCFICKKELPIGFFYLVNDSRTGTQYLSPYCFYCFREKKRKYYHNIIKTNPILYERKKAERRRQKNKSIETLSDSYISQLLSGKYSLEFLKAHPEIIKEKRKQLFKKRLKREEDSE